MNCKQFEDYMLVYLQTDVLLLADVFQSFRTTSLRYYKLDPANFFSAPGIAWEAPLMVTDVKLDLIADKDMLVMSEQKKRGGLCFVGSSRHTTANNHYMPDYDPNQPDNYIMYWDASIRP